MANQKTKSPMSKKDKKDTIIILSIFAVAFVAAVFAIIFSFIRPMLQKSDALEGLYAGSHYYTEDVIYIANGNKMEVRILQDNGDGTKSDVIVPLEKINLGKQYENVDLESIIYYFNYNNKKYVIDIEENQLPYSASRIKDNKFLISVSGLSDIYTIDIDNPKREEILSDTFAGMTKAEFEKRASINQLSLTWGTLPALTKDKNYMLFVSNRMGIGAGTNADRDLFIKNLQTGEEKMIFDHHYTPIEFLNDNDILLMYTPDDTETQDSKFVLYNVSQDKTTETISMSSDVLKKTATSFPYLLSKNDKKVNIKNAADPKNQNLTLTIPGVSRVYNVYSNSNYSKSIVGYNLSGYPTTTKFFTLIDWETNEYKHLYFDHYAKGLLLKSCYFTNDGNIGVNVSDGTNNYNYYTTLDNLKERTAEN